MCHGASFFNHSINAPKPSGPIVSVTSGIDQMSMNVLYLFIIRASSDVI